MADAPTISEIFTSARRKQGILFVWMAIGVVACISALASLQTIQTSINIEGSTGAISLTAGYIVSISFGLFCCPMLLKLAGPNGSLVIADITILVYCLSNFSQELSVLLVGAITSGIGRAIFLPSYTIAILNIATGSANLSLTKEERFYQDYYQSKFYAMTESVTIIGNFLSYAILYGFEASKNSNMSPSATETPLDDNITSTNAYRNPYQYCGVNDCQDPDIVNANIEQYEPPDRTSVYILVIVASTLAISSICIHSFVYPGLGRFSRRLQNIEVEARRKSAAIELRKAKLEHGKDSTVSSICDGVVNEPFALEKEAAVQTSFSASVGQLADKQEEIASSKAEETQSFWKTLKDTGKFLLKPRAMMLNISTLHHGMMLGFVFANVTRAYASCVAGVELTGLFTVMFGVTAMPSALLYGKLKFPRKRYIMYFTSCGLEFALYCLCYFWIPNSSDLWVVGLLFAGYGIVNGVFRQNIITAYSIHFPKSRSVAFSVFTVFFTGGLGLQYGLSIAMCVKDLIYTQVGVLVAGVILFVFAEYVRHRELRA